ncbi:helix-turn-helix transcriptional regulator [Gordonia sp. TBRC 11910]|uniref:Helix-turn-helix transcriptional regulator n=1 Tax=Gordonia asplenii TaxID=2725283 RepID=A0A848KTY6_9ACTN|nr:helix-turn-helix domain-containing protein [Gordonia asplenii]NMN99962.1 helix-turn-helix transcriptional regulator [Gordonia asplenii]
MECDRVTTLEPDGDNAIAVALGILGDEWNLWILRHAVQGAQRYGDWMGQGAISNSVLSSRLANLTEKGLFERVQYAQRPDRYEYVLTRRGAGVWTLLLSMWAWEQVWAPTSSPPLPEMRHLTCGELFSPMLICRECGKAVDVHDVVADLGPSGVWSRSVPASIARRRSAKAKQPSQMLAHTMELLGDRWSAAILGALFLGAHRFGEFSERTSAPPTMVADRLARFVRLGAVDTVPNPARPDWVSYRLTGKGLAFFPVVVFMITWGQRWFHAPEGPALIFTHRGTGHEFRPRLACDRCRVELTSGGVSIEPVVESEHE